jgi:NAD(P)-dependent dehydrogenase (short-subunit alcohol dehydrogenase family)
MMSVVAITGGARGIGLATARAFVAAGARVAIGDVDTAVLDEAKQASGAALAARLDVTDRESFRGFLDRVEAELGPLDVLVNNAGVMPTGHLLDEDDRTAQRIFEVNTLSTIRGTKLAAARMVARGHGHIVNVASMAGEAFVPGIASYCGSKAAILAFTDAARAELADTGVRFTAILPAFVNTELTAGTKPMGAAKIEPSMVADAIVDAVHAGRDKVYVPRAVGAILRVSKLLPRAFMDGISKRMGGNEVFLSRTDAKAREAYEKRARGD